MAAEWTQDPKRQIFTARLRIIETAIPSPGGQDEVKTDLVLEDPGTGQLFAAAPYASPDVVDPAIDSSRFFALRVQDEAGRKAVLGFGFEERSDAFDFNIALSEARKGLGLESGPSTPGAKAGPVEQKKAEEKRDYSLKEGETITVNFGGNSKFGQRPARPQKTASSETANLASFALPPPPSASAPKGPSPLLPPPPPASSSKPQSPSARGETKKSAADLGFDDGQFGEFA